jgi:hypothetical protein
MGGSLATMTGVQGYPLAEPKVSKGESHQVMSNAFSEVLAPRREVFGVHGCPAALVIDNCLHDGPAGVRFIDEQFPEIKQLGLPAALAVQDRLHREHLTLRSLSTKHPDYKQAAADLKQLYSEVHIVYHDVLSRLEPVHVKWRDYVPEDSPHLGCLAAFHRLMRGETISPKERQLLVSLFEGARHHAQAFFHETQTNNLSVPPWSVIRRCVKKLSLPVDTCPKVGFELPIEIGEEYVRSLFRSSLQVWLSASAFTRFG